MKQVTQVSFMSW